MPELPKRYEWASVCDLGAADVGRLLLVLPPVKKLNVGKPPTNRIPGWSSPNKRKTRTKRPSVLLSAMPQNDDAMTDQPKPKRYGCSNCSCKDKDAGHTGAKCPFLKVCKRCKGDHLVRNCPLIKKRDAQSQQTSRSKRRKQEKQVTLTTNNSEDGSDDMSDG
jgi:hypothetical protein